MRLLRQTQIFLRKFFATQKHKTSTETSNKNKLTLNNKGNNRLFCVFFTILLFSNSDINVTNS